MGVEFKGWERLRKALREFAEKFDKEATEKIAQYIVIKSQERMRKGEIKPPTSNFTLSLRRKGGRGQTLLDTGVLRNSLTYQIEGNTIKIGSNLPYAKTHQFGATIKPKKAQKLCIPATREARRLSYELGVKGALEEFRKQGYRIWFTDKAIMGQKGNGKPQVLFYRKEEVKIPQRKFVYLDDKDWEEITEMIRGWVRD